jgi:hypothetical protein
MKRITSTLIVILLLTSSIFGNGKTHFSVGLSFGYGFTYSRDSEDWGPLVGPHIQLQQGHWALRAEIDYVPKCTFFMPFVDLVYNLRPSEEGKFSPYVSIGIGGHVEMGGYFDIYSRIRVGMRLRILTAREGMLLLNVGLTSVHAFPFAPFWFSPSVGIEYSYR